jgi:hypothetical protein
MRSRIPGFHYLKERSMANRMRIAAAVAVLLCLGVIAPASALPEDETDAILGSAEACFKAMKQREYAGVWKLLSTASRRAIAADVTKRALKDYTKAQIEIDFSVGGLIAKSYWEEYLFYFDPDAALEQSRWEMGPISKQHAEVVLQHKGAGQPARLRIFKEQNQWKVGLIETFGLERRDTPRW